jgi:hypothetical protein
VSASRVVLRSILLSQASLGPSSSLAAGISPGSGIVNLTPYMDFSWADRITFILTVTAVSGSPSAGTLTAAFQLGNPHTGDAGNGTNPLYQFSDPTYATLDTAQKATLIAEGEDWPSPVCSYNSSFPVTVQRTIQNFGAMVNLQLNASTLSGGTNPAFTVSGTLIQKGG